MLVGGKGESDAALLPSSTEFRSRPLSRIIRFEKAGQYLKTIESLHTRLS